MWLELGYHNPHLCELWYVHNECYKISNWMWNNLTIVTWSLNSWRYVFLTSFLKISVSLESLKKRNWKSERNTYVYAITNQSLSPLKAWKTTNLNSDSLKYQVDNLQCQLEECMTETSVHPVESPYGFTNTKNSCIVFVYFPFCRYSTANNCLCRRAERIMDQRYN